MLNKKQIDALHGLFVHCAAVNFDGVKSDYSFYAEKLDALKVPFNIQNAIACAAECRENVYGLYFSTVLKNELEKI